MKIYNNIPALLRSYRAKQKLTQQGLADEFGVTQSTVSKWERGIDTPSISVMKKIETVVDVYTGSDIVNWVERAGARLIAYDSDGNSLAVSPPALENILEVGLSTPINIRASYRDDDFQRIQDHKDWSRPLVLARTGRLTKTPYLTIFFRVSLGVDDITIQLDIEMENISDQARVIQNFLDRRERAAGAG